MDAETTGGPWTVGAAQRGRIHRRETQRRRKGKRRRKEDVNLNLFIVWRLVVQYSRTFSARINSRNHPSCSCREERLKAKPKERKKEKEKAENCDVNDDVDLN